MTGPRMTHLRAGVLVWMVALMSCLGDMSIATLHLPDKRARLAVRREATHLYLAEYKRWLIMEHEDGRGVTLLLPPDTGGTVRMNLYQTGPTSFAVVDRVGVYVADLGSFSLKVAPRTSPSGTFIGCWDMEKGQWGFTDAAHRNELPLDQ